MAQRKIVKIDEELCNGCGECVPSCAEGAIQIIDGKARLVADNLCDGLGACLGECPEGAITIEEREAEVFDEVAVSSRLARLQDQARRAIQLHPSQSHPQGNPSGGCPGSRVMQFAATSARTATTAQGPPTVQLSELRQWPIQLHLVPPSAPYYQGADLLLAADCTAFAVGDFHAKYLKSKSIAVACPKLDHGQEIYLQKLIAMIDEARINTMTVLIMQVPCCAGLVDLAREAAARARHKVPVKQVVVGIQGEVLHEEWV